jgi:oxidase EvaA
MENATHHFEFLKSAISHEGAHITTEEVKEWVKARREATQVTVTLIPFAKMDKWQMNEETGNLVHSSGGFFSIEGIKVKTNAGITALWTQPIINQPEIGILGFITKKFNGILHFLIQAKIEPGNINGVQLSPTLQATKSNYSKVHGGKSPHYLEYFNGSRKRKILLDQLQSEQGARFYKKRNRNIIIEIDEDVELHEDFCWVTLGQIKDLLKENNLVNMDTRTVISGINYGTYSEESIQLLSGFIYNNPHTLYHRNELLLSTLDSKRSLKSIEEIISWITGLKGKYEIDVRLIPLNQVTSWKITELEISQEEMKYFSVIAAMVNISSREVTQWCQPLIRSRQDGIIAFIVKRINGILHFLVQAKVEAGNLDILELAPTVQCLTGNYRKGQNEYDVPFLDVVLSADDSKVLHRSMQSEEGGRFYLEENLNLIVEAPDDFPVEVPENFCWMTLAQIYKFIQFNNYLNIQSRSLLSVISF